MPAFFEAAFWDINNPEFWVGVGLVLFFIVAVMAKAPALIAGMLDAKANKIRADLDEAARIRAEAEALLVSLKAQRVAAEEQAAATLAAAKADAERLAVEAKAKLEETIARRAALAERKIATAEAQATADVKAAAAELAAQIAEQVLAARISGATSDPLIDKALATLGTRLQ
jgi:F-type H+-transporting ATPase subunit b